MIVAGFGFRASATEGALASALAAAGAARPDALATAADKADAPALRALAARMGLPVIAVPLAAIATSPAGTSAHAPARYAGRSLAEAAALAAAGPGARLLGPRAVSGCRRATAALAERTDP
ncbi:MAG TPA: cobalamin biosynthesis protein [Paracoccaceae bacterium]|nr:cobalamin biosynthesis protein [Paracoccaceae bacterium]